MKTEHNIPKDASHYFLWWDGIHVYKKDGNAWYWLVGNKWTECQNISYHRVVRGLFGYYQLAGSYKHKLHKIQDGAK